MNMDWESSMSQQMDPYQWLNEEFARPEAQDNPEVFGSKLMIGMQMRLSWLSQNAIHQQILSKLPRLAFNITQSLPRTHSTLSHVSKQLDQLDKSLSATTSSNRLPSQDSTIRKIRATEIVKSRMELAYRSLENQDNWGTLMSNMRDVISGGDVDSMANRIQALTKCFLSLGDSDSANHQERKRQMEDMKNSIEGTMTPRLVAALQAYPPWKTGSFHGGNEGIIMRLVHLFTLMERTETLKRVIREVRHEHFVKHCHQIIRNFKEQEEGTSIDECLKNFYEDVSMSFHAQLPLFTAIFPDPVSALRDFFLKLLSSINPDIQSLIQSNWNPSKSAASAQDFLSSLLEIKRTQDILCQTLEKESKNEDFGKLFETIRQPLHNCLNLYPQVERSIVKAEFAKISLDFSDRSKSLHVLMSCGTRIGSTFYGTLVRCFQLTDGKALAKITELFEEAVRSHIDKVADFSSAIVKSTHVGYCGNFLDVEDQGFEALNDLVKILHHSGDLIIQLENIDESLRKENFAIPHFPELPFLNSIQIIENYANQVLQGTITLILHPVETFLEKVPSLSSWSSSSSRLKADIPTFGLDPQEYITSIGNYLLTLPQIIDPLVSSENASMKKLRNVLHFYEQSEGDDSVGLAEKWIHAIIVVAMEKVISTLITIRMMTVAGIRQMMCDLRYLQNVVEDFAVPLSVSLIALLDLLSCQPDEFAAKSSSSPTDIANFVSKTRNFD